jgi:hypothetical protein
LEGPADALADDLPLAMLRQRSRPTGATPQPLSFLELAEAQPVPSPEPVRPRRRLPLVPIILMLLVVGALIGGALLLR